MRLGSLAAGAEAPPGRGWIQEVTKTDVSCSGFSSGTIGVVASIAGGTGGTKFSANAG